MKWDKNVDFIKMKKQLLKDIKELTKEKITYRRLKQITYTVILLVQLLNGCRISEAIEGVQKAATLNKNEVYVRVRKQKHNFRLIVIPTFLNKYLKLIRVLLPLINRDQVRSYARYHYSINTHSLRYAFISYLTRKGYPAQAIASITQHRKLSLILSYTKRKLGEDILKEITNI